MYIGIAIMGLTPFVLYTIHKLVLFFAFYKNVAMSRNFYICMQKLHGLHSSSGIGRSKSVCIFESLIAMNAARCMTSPCVCIRVCVHACVCVNRHTERRRENPSMEEHHARNRRSSLGTQAWRSTTHVTGDPQWNPSMEERHAHNRRSSLGTQAVRHVR